MSQLLLRTFYDSFKHLNCRRFVSWLELHTLQNVNIVRIGLRNLPEDFAKLLKHWREFPPKEEVIKELEKELLREIKNTDVVLLATKYGSEFIDNILYFSKGCEENVLCRIFAEGIIIERYYDKYYDF